MERVRTAFRDECAQLDGVLRTLTVGDLDRRTPCPPWAVRDLVAHVRTGAGRLVDMIAAPAPPRAEVDAADYFGAAKFTPEVDAARIDAARIEAARIEAGRVEAARIEAGRVEAGRREARVAGTARGSRDTAAREPGEVAAAFAAAWRATYAAVGGQPADRVVRTRHGDAMTLADFLVTRVVEVGVHGLDLAVALDREPWLTRTAAEVIVELLAGGRPVPAGLGADPLTLVRKATGRTPLTTSERARAEAAGFRWLAFGG
ncbi:maleylpyruvate isomerase N-terminal domain-containing protein [Micromonospora sp. CPCC 205711]|uniref:maleylpyruvate isomerase N-terminal domain-containing protein n=1 Tax=Micromonospora sp. CPCC 205547 TaxID=3122400 RepID=UPI002FF04DBD